MIAKQRSTLAFLMGAAWHPLITKIRFNPMQTLHNLIYRFLTTQFCSWPCLNTDRQSARRWSCSLNGSQVYSRTLQSSFFCWHDSRSAGSRSAPMSALLNWQCKTRMLSSCFNQLKKTQFTLALEKLTSCSHAAFQETMRCKRSSWVSSLSHYSSCF